MNPLIKRQSFSVHYVYYVGTSRDLTTQNRFAIDIIRNSNLKLVFSYYIYC